MNWDLEFVGYRSGVSLCDMPRIDSSTYFAIPLPGSSQRTFPFYRDKDRELFPIISCLGSKGTHCRKCQKDKVGWSGCSCESHSYKIDFLAMADFFERFGRVSQQQ